MEGGTSRPWTCAQRQGVSRREWAHLQCQGRQPVVFLEGAQITRFCRSSQGKRPLCSREEEGKGPLSQGAPAPAKLSILQLAPVAPPQQCAGGLPGQPHQQCRRCNAAPGLKGSNAPPTPRQSPTPGRGIQEVGPRPPPSKEQPGARCPLRSCNPGDSQRGRARAAPLWPPPALW